MAMPKDQGFKEQTLSNADTLFKFSRHLNVILIVLDTFQSDIFQDIVTETPELKDSFDGFTYFRNALSGSDATSISIPSMLTASNYDNSVPYLEFVKNAFLGNSLLKTLKEYSFTLDLYPIVKYSVYTDFSGVASPTKRLRDWGVFVREQAFIADLALFRAVPHFLKERIYNHQKWLLAGAVDRYQSAQVARATAVAADQEQSPEYGLKYAAEYRNTRPMVGRYWDASFINKLVPSAGIVDGTDTFKLYHLNGIHLGLIMNENLEYEPMPPDRPSMKRQGTGILKLASMILERMKQLGVYDDSLIFIVGDHGYGLSAASLRPTSAGNTFNTKGVYKGFFEYFKSAAIPLILVKRIDAHGTLALSDAPVSLLDIPQTVAEELGLDARFPGESMFSVTENESRQRIYRAFVGPQEDVEYFAPLWEYVVDGFSWDDASWKETGNVYIEKQH
jgi:hypothetical protein